jgi:rRNA-processing protein FCF1
VRQGAGFVKGFGEGVVDTVAGVAGLSSVGSRCYGPLGSALRTIPQNGEYCRQFEQGIADFGHALITDPKVTVYEAFLEEIYEDIQAGNYGEAGGSAVFTAVALVAGGRAGLNLLKGPADEIAGAGVAGAPAQQVIVDTNAVLNRPGVTSALRPGEVPVVTATTRAELSNLVARGRIKMPRFADELGSIDDVMDIQMRINIRGELEVLKPGQPGLFGDGAIGTTAIQTGSPIITADQAFAAVLRSLGVEVRVS